MRNRHLESRKYLLSWLRSETFSKLLSKIAFSEKKKKKKMKRVRKLKMLSTSRTLNTIAHCAGANSILYFRLPIKIIIDMLN